ncbi:MAG: MFS transporter [Micrococcaceae bacterium]
MVAGTYLAGKLTDWSVKNSIYISGVSTLAAFLIFTVAVHNKIATIVTVFIIAAAISVYVTPFQTRLMDVANEAQNLATSLSHSALNIANALGAWLGGLVIAAGYGYVAPTWVGVALALAGIICAYLMFRMDQNPKTKSA